jgi:crossover junction endodeoxyribonuclease RuvC
MILGIDPGSSTIGYAFLSGNKRSTIVGDYGVILTNKEYTPSQKLVQLAEDLESLILTHKPDSAVVEELFFSTNVKTGIGVAQARGVILYILERNNVPHIKLTPLQVKQTITGYGKATKKQIQQIVTKLLKLDSIPKPDDAADALALAWIGLR